MKITTSDTIYTTPPSFRSPAESGPKPQVTGSSPLDLNRTEPTAAEITKAEETLFAYTQHLINLENRTEELVKQLEEAGHPIKGGADGARMRVPYRLGVMRSTAPGKLGEIETRIFAVRKQCCHEAAVVQSLEANLQKVLAESASSPG